ncbi:hypothetical protein ABZZ79_39455 [Streptomyces sp. NPDC006458]|uniref:hypothetical protein n=1 Tax=Streptomyces sp. NPDC006458 TaxID=3154302 RepID=UPI0033A650C0
MSAETTHQLVRETIDLARAIVAGRREPGDAQRLIDHGYLVAHQWNGDWRPRQRPAQFGAPAAISLMNRVGLGAVVIHADGLRAALGERPRMAPELYLRSLCLGVLPAWPLPDDGDTEVVVYSLRFSGVASLWDAIASRDDTETDRQTVRLCEGSRWISARSLGD